MMISGQGDVVSLPNLTRLHETQTNIDDDNNDSEEKLLQL